jgi:hypothetical protein
MLVGEHSHHGAFHPGLSHQLFDRMLRREELPLVVGFGQNHEAAEVSEQSAVLYRGKIARLDQVRS